MTESENERPKKNPQSRFEKYCKKLGINPNLLMLKVTLFLMYGASASLIPFLTIHMQSIGLTVEEIAIIYLALPITTFLSPAITGFLVDKFGQYKTVVIVSLVLNGVFHHALVLIPQMETPGEIPTAYVLRHPETGKVEVWWSPCPSRECPDEEELHLVLDDCLDHCTLKNTSVHQPNQLLVGVHESIAVRPPTFISTGNGIGCGSPGLDHHGPEYKPKFGLNNKNNLIFHLDKKNNTEKRGNRKGIRKSNSTIVTKVSARPALGNDTSISSTPRPEGNITSTTTESDAALFVIDMHPDLGVPKEALGIGIEMVEQNDTVDDFRQHFEQELLEKAGINYTALVESDLRCGGFVMATNLTYSTLKELAADCMLQVCSFREGGPEVCPPIYKESDDNVFWIYFVLRFLGTTMLSASVTVMDPIALTMVQEYGGEFGRERLFSTIGMAIFSPIAGLLIDYSSRKLGYTDYSSAFYTYSFLLGVAALSVMLMPIGVKMPNDNIMEDMLKLLKMPHIIIFILFLYILGNCWGFLESYLFLYLKELGASNYLLGVTVTVGTLSSIPFLYGAESITKKLGHVNVIIAAFFAHALRLTGYSFIESAWWCFPFEAMESLSVHLMWVAAATYCSVLAPRNLLATLVGILGMAHFSLGRGSGSFIGGLLIGTVGIRQAFKAMGLTAVVGGLTYGLMHFFWLHKYTESEDANEVESEKLNSEDPEKTERDMMMESTERLSLMIRFNHRGSLTSLTGGRTTSEEECLFVKAKTQIRIQVLLDSDNSKCERDIMNRIIQSVFESNEIEGSSFSMVKNKHSVKISTYYKGAGSRRNSSNELGKALLKSALEGHYRSSNPQLNFKNSSPQLSKPKSTEPGTPQQCRRPTSQLLVNNDQLSVRRGSIKEEDENEGSEKDYDHNKNKPKLQVTRSST